MPTFGEAEIRNLTQVIRSGIFCDKQGGFMDQFRHDFAHALHARHCICGATAMLLMQAIPAAIGAGPGDEIICDPIVQFHGIACLFNNIVPVWADVQADDFLMDPKSVEKLITKRTKAIWVTHLWGFPADVQALRRIADKHKIYLLEDCAHAMFAKYKGKYLGNWGHVGTFSLNMGKQLATGEGGLAILNDDHLADELNKRIIFGESPEVLSSNYRMTEFQAAVGVEQLKKVPGYLKEYREGRKLMDAVVAECDWLDLRRELPEGVVAPYFWSCIFRGERRNIAGPVFQAALRQAGGGFGIGFLQRPAYLYNIFRNPNAYNNKGCPYNCHMYKGKVEWKAGTCPVAEDILPRLVTTNNMRPVADMRKQAKILAQAIKLAESGNVKPLEYSDLEKKVLKAVKENGHLEPLEVIALFDKKGYGHFDEHGMLSIMEGLRDRFPFKLSHAGPRKFAYHALT